MSSSLNTGYVEEFLYKCTNYGYEYGGFRYAYDCCE